MVGSPTRIAAGTPLAGIKDRLDHTSITTTVYSYGHLAPEMKEVARTAAEDAMREAGFERRVWGSPGMRK
jgi:hypothetical protein